MTKAVSTSRTVQPNGGLEGVVAAKSDICFIDGVNGKLIYRGYDIADVVENLSFEETAYLLWEGKLPNASQLSSLKRDIAASSNLPRHVQTILAALPARPSRSTRLRTAASRQWQRVIRI